MSELFDAEKPTIFDYQWTVRETTTSVLTHFSRDHNGVVIYALIDPRDQLARYIGKTTNLFVRTRSHKGQKIPRVSAWISELQSLGMQPYAITSHKLVDTDKADVVERAWIVFYEELGAPLLNAKIKLKPKEVQEITEQIRQGDFYHEIADRYGISISLVEKIALGGIWQGITGGRVYPEPGKRQGERNGRNVLSEAEVRIIKQRLEDGEVCSRLAQAYGVTEGMIRHIKKGRSWTYVRGEKR